MAENAKVLVAVVQAGAVPFDTEACVEKAARLTAEAAAKGARVIVFPEAFIPGYPKGLNYGLVVGARDPVGRQHAERRDLPAERASAGLRKVPAQVLRADRAQPCVLKRDQQRVVFWRAIRAGIEFDPVRRDHGPNPGRFKDHRLERRGAGRFGDHSETLLAECADYLDARMRGELVPEVIKRIK